MAGGEGTCRTRAYTSLDAPMELEGQNATRGQKALSRSNPGEEEGPRSATPALIEGMPECVNSEPATSCTFRSASLPDLAFHQEGWLDPNRRALLKT
eukprot:655926-Rhodomonas_salina.2